MEEGEEHMRLATNDELIERAEKLEAERDEKSKTIRAYFDEVQKLKAELDNQRKTCQNFFDENEKLKSFVQQLKEMGQEYKDQVSALEAEVKDLMDRDFDKIDELTDQLKKAEDLMDPQDLEWCDSCKDYTSTDTHFINGRVGGYDNWLPDEHIEYCEDCGEERG
jgi:small-conductance mechanosensitive channel